MHWRERGGGGRAERSGAPVSVCRDAEGRSVVVRPLPPSLSRHPSPLSSAAPSLPCRVHRRRAVSAPPHPLPHPFDFERLWLRFSGWVGGRRRAGFSRCVKCAVATVRGRHDQPSRTTTLPPGPAPHLITITAPQRKKERCARERGREGQQASNQGASGTGIHAEGLTDRARPPSPPPHTGAPIVVPTKQEHGPPKRKQAAALDDRRRPHGGRHHGTDGGRPVRWRQERKA